MSETTAIITHKAGTPEETTIDLHIFHGDGSLLLGLSGYAHDGTSFRVQHAWISLENLEKLVKVAKQARKRTPAKMRKFEDEWRAERSTFEVVEE